jgi:hypothetical protein
MSTKKLQDPPLLGSKKHKLGLLLSEKERNAILAQKIGSDLDQYAQLRTVDINLLKYIWWVTLDRDEGLRALCGIYAIREGADCFYWLAMSLARQFLAPRKPAGAKKKWSKGDFARLVIEVEALEKEKGRSKSWVYKQLARKDPYKTLLLLKNPRKTAQTPEDTLKKHYENHKNDPFVMQVKLIIQEQLLDVPIYKLD